MERSGGGRENEGILYAMRIKQRYDSSGIASLVLKKKHEKKKKYKDAGPQNSDVVHFNGGLLVFGSKRSLVFANLTAPAVVGVSELSTMAMASGWYILSAGEETALLGHLVAVFAVGAQAEEDTSDEDNRETHDGSVCFPVLGLRVPTTSG